MSLRSLPIKKYNFVYKTVNMINGKSYIGYRCTNNLNDGYIGCGIKSQAHADNYKRHNIKSAFIRAVCKYGYKNFHREILSFHDTRELAILKEKELVNKEWVEDKMTYNCSLGGSGGCLSTKLPHESEIIHDYINSHLSVAEIASKYGIKYSQVIRVTRGQDYSSRKKTNSPRIRDAKSWINENIESIIERYKNGESLEKIDKTIPMYIYDSIIPEIVRGLTPENKYVCVTPENKVIEFHSTKEINDILGIKLFHAGIRLSCRGEVTSYKGFDFYYIDDYKNNTKVNKKVGCSISNHAGQKFIDRDGNIHTVKNNLSEFSREHKLIYELIFKVAKGQNSHHKGFRLCQN